MPARFDDPNLDLVEVARAVLRGEANLTPDARADMVRAIGIKPEPGASSIVVARAFLAARGARP
ncbi:MAG: hypothetical protein JO257_05985 [Deltaproteobacteria bacterium]|nr:hypothetical protein [Deltaproteobacteria bacterium]